MISELFKKLDSEGLWTATVSLDRNEFLIQSGAVEHNIYFVQSGTLRVFIGNGKDEHTIRFGYPGTLFTALDSFLTGKPTSYSIQAIKKSVLRAMAKSAFLKLIATKEEYGKLYVGIVENLIVQQMEREVDLLTPSPEERYKRVLERSPNLFQEIPSRYIASYLRMTPETLSRLKKS